MKIRKVFQRIFQRKTIEEIELEWLLAKGLKMGKNSYINSNFQIDTGWPWLITIGDNVMISSNVTILAHDASTNVVGCSTKLGKVKIGNNVFIGTGAIVLCNTHIGDNVVIGAGSVVTHDLPSNGVYAGIPAKRICSIEDYKKRNEELREISPHFDTIKSWNKWKEATLEEKEMMQKELGSGVGFV